MQTLNLLNKKDEYIKEYLNILSYIIEAAISKDKGELSSKVKDKFFIAKTSLPEETVKKSGIYLWKYRKYVKNEEFEKLLEMNFEQEQEQIKKESKDELAQRFQEILSRLRHVWTLFNINEKNIIKHKIKCLLQSYANYALIISNIK